MKIQKNKGFTLAELLVVVALMVTLGVLIIGSLQTQRKKSRDNIRIAGIQQIRLALEEYKLACGQYPARLDADMDNGRCPAGVTFGTFLPHLPKNPVYAEGHNKTGQTENYQYSGLSSSSDGPCYEYHIAVQLEYDADNDFDNVQDGKNLSSDHDWNNVRPYTRLCRGSNPLIRDADDDSFGLYDFRSRSY